MIFGVLEGLLAFILVLGPLVFIHELGHFLVAKAFGVAVPVFSIGFGPRIAGFRRGETDYRLSLIPLGGYVRMAGDEADENRSGLPHEFLSKPKWQRFFIFVAGAAFNVILAFVAFWALFSIYGKDEVLTPETYPTVMSVAEGSASQRAGIERGDRLLAIGGRDVGNAEAYHEALNLEVLLAPGTTKPVEIERDGQTRELPLEVGLHEQGHGTLPGWYVTWGGDERAAEVRDVVAGDQADLAGLEPGDRIVGAAGQQPLGEIELRTLIESSAGRALTINVERDGEPLEITLEPVLREGRGMIGVVFKQPIVHRDLTLVEAARESWRENLNNSRMLFVVLKKFGDQLLWNLGLRDAPGLSLKSVSGPIGIAQVARRALLSDSRTFLWLIGFFSLQLGILNLLPIPVLDGGHILILMIEGVIRRDLSERIKEGVMTVGFVFLLAFMSYVIVMDVMKL